MPLQQLDNGDCEIGSGGNGSVFVFKCSGGCFAIKKVQHAFNNRTEQQNKQNSLTSKYPRVKIALLSVLILFYSVFNKTAISSNYCYCIL